MTTQLTEHNLTVFLDEAENLGLGTSVSVTAQSLNRDFGVFSHLWQNVAHRVARTRK